MSLVFFKADRDEGDCVMYLVSGSWRVCCYASPMLLELGEAYLQLYICGKSKIHPPHQRQEDKLAR